MSKSRRRSSVNAEVKPTILSIEGNLAESGYDPFNDQSTAEFVPSKIKNIDLQFRNEHQKEFAELIDTNEIVIASGPAGTGKSYISVVKALLLMKNFPTKYKKIIITTPAQESEDEKLGFLPGSVDEKLAPHVYSTYYLFKKVLGDAKVDKMIKAKKIELVAFAFMRGVNIDNSILICEEAQNTTKRQMKLLLTRIGEESKFIISGDLEQLDRKLPKNEENGLVFAMRKLRDTDNIGVLEFDASDVVRNPLIPVILKKFNGDVD